MQMMTRRGVQWISCAADDPDECREAWLVDPRRPYAFPAGRFFDVVVVGQRVGLETFDQLQRHGMPLGPVMADRASGQVGFFVPTGAREPFGRMVRQESADEAPEYRYLGEGSVVVVPGPMPLTGDRYIWLRAPMRRPEASPSRIAALAAMFVAASSVVARADRYGREQTAASAEGEATHAG
ncbi:bifunctional DNA primase/polymerase [Streptomyces sp. RK75]|nr:bifunctional DNA primase/polymerase [Streptomyces sp. RK75]